MKLYNIVDEDNTNYPFESFVFSGGEPHIKINPDFVRNQRIWVDARPKSGTEFMQLLVFLDTLRSLKPDKLGLFIPYFPGARQDRRQVGTPHTLKVYAELLEKFELDEILVLDPHSDVLGGLLNINTIEPQEVFIPLEKQYDGIICPDAGAEKRVRKFAEKAKIDNIIFCHKKRNTNDGKLSHFEIVGISDNNLGHFLMVDDICDGGATFIGLADHLFNTYGKNNIKLDLFVSHGIFSKGFNELLLRFEKIITTDSMISYESDRFVTIKSLFWHAAYKMRELLKENS